MCNIQTPDISTAPPQLNQTRNKHQDITVTSLQGTSSLITDSNVSTESGHFLFQKLLPQKTGACLRLDEQQWSQSSCSRPPVSAPDISFKRQNKRNSFLALFSQSQRWLWLPSSGSEILVLSRLKYKHKQGEHAFFSPDKLVKNASSQHVAFAKSDFTGRQTKLLYDTRLNFFCLDSSSCYLAFIELCCGSEFGGCTESFRALTRHT